MATSYQRTASNTPLHNRHYEETTEAKLPSGSCNFRNLDPGGNSATCGCKRFWSQASGESRSGFCFCEHHACYHDEFPEAPRKSSIDAASEAPQAIVKPMNIPAYIGQGPVNVGVPESVQAQSTLPDTLQFSRYIHDGSSLRLGLPAIPSQCLLPSDNGSMTSSSQERYTRPFGGLGLGTLSHIPPVSGFAKPGYIASTKFSQIQERKLHIYRDDNGNEYLQSLTEGATPSLHTPSVQTSQDPAESEPGKNITSIPIGLDSLAQKRSQGHSTVAFRPVSKGSTSTAIKQSASHPVDLAEIPSDCDEDEYLMPKIRTLVNQMSDFPNRMQNHEHRLELLENTSFTNPALDDLHDADDRMETRVGDIEDRILELEKVHSTMNDTSSVGSKQLIENSFCSRASVTSSAMTVNRVDPARIEALEAHIAELQSVALPSFSRPWQVEVVFLPYGPRLMGIWSNQHTSTQRLGTDSEAKRDCTPMQQSSIAAAQVQLISHDQDCAWERSASDLEQQDAPWSMAKACGTGSRVAERLRSRGLVKTIQILGPDARDVQAAMVAAFGDLPALLKEDPYSIHRMDTGIVPSQLKAFQALQSPWVPLRKIHKDSCLRFLNASEMISQALWTVPFLTSNVAMRQKDVKRLYVTQSDSYVQHLGDNTVDWTWQKLRRLPRVYPEEQSLEGHTPEGDANEPCWNFDDRLDPVEESYHSSFASHISSLSIHSPNLGIYQPKSQSDHFSSAPNSPDPSTTSTSIAPTSFFHSSPVRERHPFRALSMSAALPSKPSQPIKRRITSFDQESHSHSRTPSTATNYVIPKRRRISRSPSRPRDTPRYSDGPPSPYNYMDDRMANQNDRLTPFAYATPHSNAPYIDHAQARSAIGIYEDADDDPGSATDDMDADNVEANALSDSDDEAQYAEQERQLDEEWEGLDDDDLRGRVMYESMNVLRPEDEDDAPSETSSAGVPSEYPSKQPEASMFPVLEDLGYGRVKSAFRIHVDEEVDERM